MQIIDFISQFVPTDKDALTLYLALFALAVSLHSAWSAHGIRAQKRKDDRIKDLLGEKETVSFAAVKLLREGLPRNSEDRAEVLAAVMQVCVLEGSNRSRAMLFAVLAENKYKYRGQIDTAYCNVLRIFEKMDKFKLTRDEFDPTKARLRLGAIQKVIAKPVETQCPTASPLSPP